MLVVAQTRVDSLRAVYGDTACCTFTEGDSIREDRIPIAACMEKTGGTPGIVDPLRLTPHPCCPNAKGKHCGP